MKPIEIIYIIALACIAAFHFGVKKRETVEVLIGKLKKKKI